MSHPLNFRIEGYQRWMLLASPWILAGFMLLSVSLPFLPDARPGGNTFMLWFSVITAIGWGVAAGYSFRVVRRLHLTAFTADAEGLWPSALPRDSSLVRWAEIAKVRERPRLQRLELLSESGMLLARLEYQLSGFERLRTMVLKRSWLPEAPKRSAHGVYGRSMWHHAFTFGVAIALAALGWYIGESQPVIGYGGMAFVFAMIGWEYWTSPYRISVDAKGILVALPARTRVIPRHMITSIELADDFANHMRHPHVVIKLREPERPVLLKRFMLPSVELVQVLQAWLRGDA